MDLMIFRNHNHNSLRPMIKRENEEEQQQQREKRTNNNAFERTRRTYRWIYERFVSYEPLCFTCVIFVQNDALLWWEKKLMIFFFEKRTRFFLCVSSFLGAKNSFGQSRLLEEKKMKATPPLIRLVASTPPPRPSCVGCFC